MLVNIHTHRHCGDAITVTTAGIHPWHAEVADWTQIESMAAPAEAIGEIGLDGACGVPDLVQEQVFIRQLHLAERLGKPVVLHCVKRFERVMDILHGFGLQAVIFHGFTGSAEQTQKACARGYYISYGQRTFRSPKAMTAMRATPHERLFLETDEADVTIAAIYTKAAATTGMTVDELERITNENYNRIFRR